jgi:thiamine-monophosphate kinase
MALAEFSLIDRFFRQPNLCPEDDNIVAGIGDDAALLRVPPGRQLVVCADTLVQGVHFPEYTAAGDIGYRALVVNLSDIAAMAAEPRWYTLCLTLPTLDDVWLQDFCQGMVDAATPAALSLIGGDTTAGPLSVSVQMLGLVAPGKALRRSGAQSGDAIYVTGYLGDAAAGLAQLQGADAALSIDGTHRHYLTERFYRPRPRLAEAGLLHDIATSCIDISDGLLADLGHICTQSRVAARIEAAALPLSVALSTLPRSQALDYALAGGDDYELCFTVPVAQCAQLEQRFAEHGSLCRRIGEVVDQTVGGTGVRCLDENGGTLMPAAAGYEHFR